LLRKLADVTARMLFVILGRSWGLGFCWRKANFTSVVRKGKKEDLGSYRLVTLPSGTGKTMDKILLETVSRHTKNEKVTRNSKCRFTKANHVCPEYSLQ